jgi:phenylpyruvate tautomerase PptA (4-oxalocrotonate tautomerase family)
MPAYQCASPKGLLDERMKSQVANAITDAHVAVTGGPREFVHVFFTELPHGDAYSAGQPDAKVSMITGTIRAGRTLEAKQQLIRTITEAWSRITGQSSAHIVAAVAEIAPEAVMEYGVFLPAPGDEVAWFYANSDVLPWVDSA